MNALFDLDGTLCDPRDGIVRGFRHAFSVLSRPFPDERLAVSQIGRPLGDCFRALGCGQDSDEAARHFHEFFCKRGFAEAALYSGVCECLDGLRKEGWGLAVASSKPTGMLRIIVADLGLMPYFQGLYGCASNDLNPDKRAIVSAALRGLSWSPEQTVLIGDRAQDRDAAKALRMVYVAAAWGFGSLEEYSGAHAVAASPSQLPSILGGLSGSLADAF